MQGLRFRPQHPIDIFIADFYCHPLKLVIEIDGGIHKLHEQAEYDFGHEGEIENWGIKVIRYTNEEIENNIKSVLETIKQECISRQSEIQKSPLQSPVPMNREDLGVKNKLAKLAGCNAESG